MKRQMFFATVFSAALAVGVAAQEPPTAQTPSQDKGPQQVTFTGCLAQAPSPSTGATGTSGTAAGGTQFILKDATPGAGAAGATGTSGAPSSSAMGKSYKLIGGSPDDFKSNVNAKVEIKGTLQPASGAAPPASSQSDKDLPTLRVTSVKKIADTCSGQ